MSEPQNPYDVPQHANLDTDLSHEPLNPVTLAQITVVAILQGVVGLLEFGIAGTVVWFATMDHTLADFISGNVELSWITLYLATMASGGLRVVSAFACYAHRYWWLTVISLVVGLTSSFTCLCMMPGVVLAVYGLIILCSPTARNAFAVRRRTTAQ